MRAFAQEASSSHNTGSGWIGGDDGGNPEGDEGRDTDGDGGGDAEGDGNGEIDGAGEDNGDMLFVVDDDTKRLQRRNRASI